MAKKRNKSRGKAAPRVHRFSAEALEKKSKAKRNKRLKIAGVVLAVIILLLLELLL